MAESQDVNTLKRRGRRRLVGAIALVLLAAIVLPMVFDPEPKFTPAPVSVRIPGEDDASFAPKAHPKGQAPQSAATPVPAPATGLSDLPKSAAKSPDAPLTREIAQPATAPAAQPSAASSPAAGQFIVQVGAFTDPSPVIGKLQSAKLPYYTESVAVAKGRVTRVRVGPYATRDSAEEAQRALKRLGLNPGNVIAKS